MIGYYLIAVFCAFFSAVGQILFKLSANLLRETSNSLNFTIILILFLAFATYGAVTITWVWLLQKLPLSRLYPVLALTFVFVPIGGYFIFKEQFSSEYFLGLFLIISGTAIIIKNREEK